MNWRNSTSFRGKLLPQIDTFICQNYDNSGTKMNKTRQNFIQTNLHH